MVDNRFVTDVKTKANFFNNFFAEQCTPLKEKNVLPIHQKSLTQSRLVSSDFDEDEILNIIRTLNIHKTHGHDDISIRMIKTWDKFFLKPLIFLFQSSTKLSYYPDIWKRSIVPLHKIIYKQLTENYNYLTLP